MQATIATHNLTAIINLKGAELISLKNEFDTEFIWDANPEFWGKHAPVLFPIVGNLKNDSYQYKNQNYPLSRHGFARDFTFEVIDETTSSVTFSLHSSEETLKVYPFQFELQIQYSIQGKSLQIHYSVFNFNDFEMPFSLGAHPAFALPGVFTDYSLGFENANELEYFTLDNDLISDNVVELPLENGQLPLNYKLFENDALIFKQSPAKSISVLKNGNPMVTVVVENFPNLGIWTKVNAPFLCIEPWFGYADTINATGKIMEKEGIQILSPKQKFSTRFHINII